MVDILKVYAIAVGILGLLIGSFLNVCIYRIPIKKSVTFPASHCPICKKKLVWYENIPIFSYFIIARGRCNKCGSKISYQYPLIESITGILFYLFFLKFGWSITTLIVLIMVSMLIVASVIDIKGMIIPDRISGMLIILGIISSIFLNREESSILGIGAFSLIFLILYGYGDILGKEVMGFGDVKLAMGIGSIIGYTSLRNLLLFWNIAFVSGALVGLLLIILKIKTRKEEMAFGPFIAISGLATLYFC